MALIAVKITFQTMISDSHNTIHAHNDRKRQPMERHERRNSTPKRLFVAK